MRILVADDDATFRSLVVEILTDAGYEVSAHENGLLAWEALRAGGADLAVLDINMPEMDGFQLLRNIRGDGRFAAMPVLMLTIRAFAEDQVEGYETGADDYLTKPFDNDVLLARVKVLERRILGS
ncbi:MAG TPA: response regulator transcription factor [Elusimicrobiales bacterium]|nr:response regulator transcription factor [Elusimicrobiales bacterium]